jgi:hypothetical protein
MFVAISWTVDRSLGVLLPDGIEPYAIIGPHAKF